MKATHNKRLPSVNQPQKTRLQFVNATTVYNKLYYDNNKCYFIHQHFRHTEVFPEYLRVPLHH